MKKMVFGLLAITLPIPQDPSKHQVCIVAYNYNC